MAHHFLSFLLRAFVEMPSRIGSSWGGTIFSVFLFLIPLAPKAWRRDSSGWKRRLTISVLFSAIGWTILFLVSVFLTVWDDHSNLVAAAERIKLHGRDEVLRERRKAAELLDLNQPRFSAMAYQANIQTFRDGGTGILLVLEIRNRGADSIADQYEMWIDFKDKPSSIRGRLRVSNASILNLGNNVFHTKDSLPDKTAIDPIKRGTKVVGYVWASFNGLNANEVLNDWKNGLLVFRLTFRDINGQQYELRDAGTPNGVSEVLQFPGMSH